MYKAIIYDNETVKLIEKSIPKIKKGYALVKIYAAGVNPVDAKNVVGDKLPHNYFFQSLAKKIVRNKCPGFDFSGIIEEIGGLEESTFKPGDKVYGTAKPFDGTFCNRQLIPLDQIQLMPKKLSFVEAASIPLVGLTCYQSFKLADEQGKNNSHVLIIGASGGVGHFAIQFAKRFLNVNRVVGICGTSNLEWVKVLGADRVIDYKKEDWKNEITEEVCSFGSFSFVLDTVYSNEKRDQSLAYQNFLLHVNKDYVNGKYLRLGGGIGDWITALVVRKFGLCSTKKCGKDELFWVRFPKTSEELDIINKAVEEYGILPFVSVVLPFSENGVIESFNRLRSRRTVGKIVVRIEK
jgi:NADPH:quinone reductase-like Zn-dependent oxidoreductase